MVVQATPIVERLTGHARAYTRRDVVRYCAALLLRHFVILAGPTAVDKISLARGLAETLAGRPDEQWCLLPGHPWWMAQAAGAGHLLDVYERFTAYKLLDFMAAARDAEASGRPFFVGVDRMSPAEVACYFEDLPEGLLWQPGAIATRIALPPNLYVTGTLDAAAKRDLVLSPAVCRQAAVIWLDRQGMAASPAYAAQAAEARYERQLYSDGTDSRAVRPPRPAV